MKQIFMKKKIKRRASLSTEEVPVPKCSSGTVLLANRHSLISAGTETAAVKRDKKDMVVKALTDPEIRQTLKDMLFQDGIKKTADRVQFEMTKWTPLGYSGAGIVVEVGRDIEGIQEGDIVAYAGEGHSEYIRASKNLCVRIPNGVTTQEAAFVALGSIAMQGIRRAEIQIGETVALIGLGLVGQLANQLLISSGGRVLAIDMMEERIKLAKSLGAEEGFTPSDQLPKEIMRYTGGKGVDHVVICASTTSNSVINQAVEMCRERGRITVVGAIGLDVPHEKFYYKELELRISRSYGPGRYDPQYEQHGIDYPLGYVRWTEKRNMEEFLRLIQSKQVDVNPLITNDFSLNDVDKAYDLLITKPNECLAILLKYDEIPDPPSRNIVIGTPTSTIKTKNGPANIAVVGCGYFARQFHLPYVKDSSDLCLSTLVTSSSQNAKEMGAYYGASSCSTDWREALKDDQLDAVMVFTRDNSHASITTEFLKAGKHVFCEKPLTTTYEECAEIVQAVENRNTLCMVGFNRRFAPLMVPIKETLSECKGRRVIHYRVNAGPLPKDNWVFDPHYAAGRVIGEVCHFTDLFYYLLDCEPISVFTQSMGEIPSINGLEDISACFKFSDGSIANLIYTALGTTSYAKERLEIFTDGSTLVLDDYKEVTIRGKKYFDTQNKKMDKGHTAELEHFSNAIRGKEPLTITHRDGIRGTVCCLKIFESAKTGEPVDIDMSEYF